jgi:hypothetical protein
MNAVIEEKLKDLMEESRRQNAPAVHVVTHMLLACCANGMQNDFAKWVCQYSSGISVGVGVSGGQPMLPGEITFDTDEKQWVC